MISKYESTKIIKPRTSSLRTINSEFSCDWLIYLQKVEISITLALQQTVVRKVESTFVSKLVLNEHE